MQIPTLCTKCFLFPCICGYQYKTLPLSQLETLKSNILNLLKNHNPSSSLKECLGLEELEKLPKRFSSLLFEAHAEIPLSKLWVYLKNNNPLWSSCLALFLSKYSPLMDKNTQYDFIVNILNRFDMDANTEIAQILLAADKEEGVDVALILATSTDLLKKLDDNSKRYLQAILRIISFKPTQSAIILLEAMRDIILSIAGLEDQEDIIDSGDLNIEDQMYFIDESLWEMIQELIDGDFGSLMTS